MPNSTLGDGLVQTAESAIKKRRSESGQDEQRAGRVHARVVSKSGRPEEKSDSDRTQGFLWAWIHKGTELLRRHRFAHAQQGALIGPESLGKAFLQRQRAGRAGVQQETRGGTIL